MSGLSWSKKIKQSKIKLPAPPPEKPPRPKIEIESEYVKVCQDLGDKYFRSELLKVEMSQSVKALAQLNVELSRLPPPEPKPMATTHEPQPLEKPDEM